MALTVSELEALKSSLVTARANGVREVKDQNGESVTYKSDAEMARAIAYLESQINQSGSEPVKVVRVRYDKEPS